MKSKAELIKTLEGVLEDIRKWPEPPKPIPTFKVQGCAVDPSRTVARCWIKLSEEIRHTVYFTVNFGGNYKDGSVKRTQLYLAMRPGEPRNRQFEVPLVGTGNTQGFLPVSVSGSGIGTDPEDPYNVWSKPVTVSVNFMKGAVAEDLVPYPARQDRTPTRGPILWASDPTWSNFKAQAGGGVWIKDEIWDTGGENGRRVNNREPVIYGDEVLIPGTKPWEIVDGELVLRVQYIGKPVVSPNVKEGSKPFSAAMVRANFINQKYNCYEWCVKFGGGYGTWPGVWTLPFDGSWPPEQDASEVYFSKTWNNGVTVVTMHMDNGKTLSVNVDLRKIFDDPELDLSKNYFTHIMDTREDWTTVYIKHYDGRIREIACFPTENGDNAMYPLMDLTLQNDWSQGMIGPQSGYEDRYKYVAFYA